MGLRAFCLIWGEGLDQNSFAKSPVFLSNRPTEFVSGAVCSEDPGTKAVVKSAVITVVAVAAGGGIASILSDLW